MHWLRRISWKIKSGQGNRTIIELSVYTKIKSHRLLMTNFLKNSKSLTFGMRGNTWPNPIQNNQIQFFSLTTLNMPKMEIIHLFFIELLVIIAVSHLNGQEHFGYNCSFEIALLFLLLLNDQIFWKIWKGLFASLNISGDVWRVNQV